MITTYFPTLALGSYVLDTAASLTLPIPIVGLAEWVKDLRSGKFHQGKGLLRGRDTDRCCLGVYMESRGAEWLGYDKCYRSPYSGKVANASIAIPFVPDPTFDHRGFGTVLSQVNDLGATFEEIATYVEAVCVEAK